MTRAKKIRRPAGRPKACKAPGEAPARAADQAAPASRGKTTVLVVDDHPIVRRGLVELVNSQPDLSVCAEADSGAAALALLAELHCDLALIDLSLQDTTGIELTRDLKTRHPELPVLILSMHDESVYAERALHAGARGYLMKEEITSHILEAIRTVLSGRVYLSQPMTARLLDRAAGARTEAKSALSCLSDRELEIFEMIGQGLGTSAIAGRLHLSVKTVETHRAHLKEKLRLGSASELQYYAICWSQSRPRP